MTNDGEESTNLCDLPTEVLLYIFTFLPGRQLARIRQVCLRWKHIIDGLTRSDVLWRGHCRTDFEDVYKTARLKAKCGLLWFNIYRSLSLWPLLKTATEVHDEFASASCVSDEIRNFVVLKDGVIGVHKRDSIVYYDIDTLEQSKRGTITGDYMHYSENEDVLVIQSYHLQLFVIRKILHNPNMDTNATFDSVKTFILVDKDIYFVTLNNQIHFCRVGEGNLSSTCLKQCEESIMSLGFSDGLNVLTFQRNIYSIIDTELVQVCCLDDCSNLVQQLNIYKLLETVDWRIFFQWLCILRVKLPIGPLREIMTVRKYGDVLFVGCNWGVLRIYYAPYSSGELDFYDAEPVKQYNFMERSDCPVLTMSPILQVDALESEDGHTVIVAMPKKIAVLEFVHSFKRSASVAMLPYCDTEKVKILRIDDF